MRRKITRGFYVLSGELGVLQAFLARWYIGGGNMDVSEVVVFIYNCATIINKYNHFRNIHVAPTDVPTRQKRLGHP